MPFRPWGVVCCRCRRKICAVSDGLQRFLREGKCVCVCACTRCCGHLQQSLWQTRAFLTVNFSVKGSADLKQRFCRQRCTSGVFRDSACVCEQELADVPGNFLRRSCRAFSLSITTKRKKPNNSKFVCRESPLREQRISASLRFRQRFEQEVLC